jgi:uncharacterized protein YbjT (DUF2867 family)
MNYLISGATGDVGSKVVELLLQRGMRPRIFARDKKKAHGMFGDRVDVFVGDLAEPSSLAPALTDVEAFFLVNAGPEIPQRDEAAAQLAKAAGVTRLVKLSSMDVQHGLAIGAWHERGEAAIRAMQIPFTLVQPTGFMANLLAWSHAIKQEGVVRSSTDEGKRAFVHSQDIAAVSVEALLSDRFVGQSLPITGPQALSFREATKTIGDAIGRPLTYEPISDEEAGRRYARVSGSREETEAHVALWRAIREGRLATVTDGVEQILQRKPMTLHQWAMENANTFIPESLWMNSLSV